MMKRAIGIIALIFCFIHLNAQEWVRVNRAGYLPSDRKVAVYLAVPKFVADNGKAPAFTVRDAVTDRIVFRGSGKAADAARWGMGQACRLDFSGLRAAGGYYIECGGAKSPAFRIGTDVYDGLADFLLAYMRQQRCGDNPYTGALCHQHDGYIVDHPSRSGERIDVRGGWHDATDYLQYVTTSATAAYQMLFAYREQEDKSVFGDKYDARGRKGANGIPDILDEARWGLEWLMKMNPEERVMFNQIADDRDHAGYRFPQRDSVDYGWGKGTGRPVYFVTGRPQGLGKWINRTTGVASTAGKFASAFALGAEVFGEIDPSFAGQMKAKAEQAYRFAEEVPGNTQTACLASPYFYEEDTYTDDIELAAAALYSLTEDPAWEKRADYWGELEPVSPWMELGRGRHYQYYPFVNLGHFHLANSSDPVRAEKYRQFMFRGLEALRIRGAEDPFLNGIPYIWCSNNLTSAAITQARLYHKATGDTTYIEMETALRDWLLGCNPWGTSMIVGYPAGADTPERPHSSYTVLSGDLTPGGLVDGPVYRTVFEERAGGALTKPDDYAVFNRGIAVYHDDTGDYASNEPTMDGTAGLTYYFAEMEASGRREERTGSGRNSGGRAAFESGSVFGGIFPRGGAVEDEYGAAVRIDPDKKNIYLVFTADSLFQGGRSILKSLRKEGVKGSFFLTGNCLRMKEHESLIREIVRQGHYVGGHSDAHLLYASWERRDSALVGRDSLERDLKLNLGELGRFGISGEECRWFLPPYEYYNRESVNILKNMGVRPVNYTPGTATPADYTAPSMKSYRSSQALIDALYAFEEKEGLNGAVILIHPGPDPQRTDLLYDRLEELIRSLKGRGYGFASLKEADPFAGK